jgi:hypothetical protein
MPLFQQDRDRRVVRRLDRHSGPEDAALDVDPEVAGAPPRTARTVARPSRPLSGILVCPNVGAGPCAQRHVGERRCSLRDAAKRSVEADVERQASGRWRDGAKKSRKTASRLEKK